MDQAAATGVFVIIVAIFLVWSWHFAWVQYDKRRKTEMMERLVRDDLAWQIGIIAKRDQEIAFLRGLVHDLSEDSQDDQAFERGFQAGIQTERGRLGEDT